MFDELLGHLGEMFQHLSGAFPHIRLVVRNIVLLAERLDELMHFPEVVSRDHGEEVMIYLVLQTTAEPVNENVGRYISSSGDLFGEKRET